MSIIIFFRVGAMYSKKSITLNRIKAAMVIPARVRQMTKIRIVLNLRTNNRNPKNCRREMRLKILIRFKEHFNNFNFKHFNRVNLYI